MTQYFTNFASDTLGAAPSGWTKRWSANITPTVKEVDGLRVMEFVSGGSSAWDLLSWDAIDSDGERQDTEILTRIKIAAFGAGSGQFIVGAAARCSGSTASRSGWTSGVADEGSGGRGRIAVHNSGSVSNLLTSLPAFSAGTWYWVRTRFNGSTQKLKYWTGNVGDEPAGWSQETSDSRAFQDGWVGLSNFRSGVTSYIDYFAVGTAGDAAPSPAGSAPENLSPPTLTIDSTSFTGDVGSWDAMGAGPLTYAWELRDDTDAVIASGTGTTISGSGTFSGQYYLWVEATNSVGSTEAVCELVEVGGEATIALGQSSEAESLQPLIISNPRSYATGQSIESESLQPLLISNPRSYAVGTASEAESASPLIVANPRSYTLGQAIEAESASPLSVSAPGSIDVGSAIEAERALPLVISNPRTYIVGQVVEAEAVRSLTITNPRFYTLDQATEAETSFSLEVTQANSQTIVVGQATVIEAALPLIVSNPRTYTLGNAVESESAISIGVSGPASDVEYYFFQAAGQPFAFQTGSL